MGKCLTRLNLKSINLYQMQMTLKPFRRFKIGNFNEEIKDCDPNIEDKIKRNLLQSNLGSFLNIRLYSPEDNAYCHFIDNARYFKTTMVKSEKKDEVELLQMLSKCWHVNIQLSACNEDFVFKIFKYLS